MTMSGNLALSEAAVSDAEPEVSDAEPDIPDAGPDPVEPLLQPSALKAFGFHQLVSLLELHHAGKPPVGTLGHPEDEYVRFRATRSLSFGASDISEVRWDERDERLEVRINFLGLYGPASPLPPYYTERIIEDDQTPAAVEDLFDLFNHRFISLFHVIWRKYRYFLRYEQGGADAISKRFLALCGFPIEDRTRIGHISRSALLPHVGLLSLHSSSADTVAATISNFFDIPCSIKEFVSRSVDMDSDNVSRLGAGSLGEDIVLGSRLWDDFGKFRIRLGEASFEELSPFLPGGERHQALIEILTMVNREPLDWDIEYTFRAGTLPAATLGSTKLGWTSWVSSDPSDSATTVILAPAPEIFEEAVS